MPVLPVVSARCLHRMIVVRIPCYRNGNDRWVTPTVSQIRVLFNGTGRATDAKNAIAVFTKAENRRLQAAYVEKTTYRKYWYSTI